MKEDEQLVGLLQAYRERNAALRDQRRRSEEAAIRRLEVARSSGPDASESAGFLVSVDLAGAPLSRVVERILDLTMAPYNLSTVRLNGTATARFNALPLLEALNQLLGPHGLSVVSQGGVLVFRQGGAIDSDPGTAVAGSGPDQPQDSPTLYQEVGLHNLSAADAVALLKDLYGSDDDDDDDDSPSISFGSLSELNSVFLAGPRAAVREGVALLNRADREVPHVLIEALVVELDVTAAIALGTEITGGASGEFSGISLLPGGLGENISFGFLNGAMNATQASVLIDLLVSQDKAQILSRPYLAALSNHQATIEIAQDRFVAVEQSDEGAAIATTDSITAGVKLQITPVVAADGMIRVDLQVEESEFEPTVGDVLVQKDRNTAQTAMSVRSGQTIVVGGLNARRHATTNSGLPWLRRVPVLNFLFAKQESLDENKEVVVYLTPRIWTPALDSPLDQPQAPGVENHPFTSLERLGGTGP